MVESGIGDERFSACRSGLDLPVRLFHWLVVALVAAAYATWRPTGWSASIDWRSLLLVVFQLLWGFSAARRRDFPTFSPRRAWFSNI